MPTVLVTTRAFPPLGKTCGVAAPDGVYLAQDSRLALKKRGVARQIGVKGNAQFQIPRIIYVSAISWRKTPHPKWRLKVLYLDSRYMPKKLIWIS